MSNPPESQNASDEAEGWPLSYVLSIARDFAAHTNCACDPKTFLVCWRCLMRGALAELDAARDAAGIDGPGYLDE